MGFFDAIGSGFANYVNFNGRASRAEFWWWQLFTWLSAIVVAMIDAGLDSAIFNSNADHPGILSSLLSLALLLPNLSIGVRRLHDTRHSGWWTLLAFTGIGWILLFIWGVTRGTLGPNEFGPDPLGGQAFPAMTPFGGAPGGAMAYPSAAPGSAGGIAAEIERLGRLRAQGALTDEEFAAAKARLLRQI